MQHFLIATSATSAGSTVLNGLNTAAVDSTAAGYGTVVPISTIVGNLIGVILGISGILFLCLMVYAGILYLTANGEEAGVKKAKHLITSAIIGIIIVMASYAITAYVVAALTATVTA